MVLLAGVRYCANIRFELLVPNTRKANAGQTNVETSVEDCFLLTQGHSTSPFGHCFSFFHLHGRFPLWLFMASI